eukprot:1058084-Karenia_brevis.AAC.1
MSKHDVCFMIQQITEMRMALTLRNCNQPVAPSLTDLFQMPVVVNFIISQTIGGIQRKQADILVRGWLANHFL